MGLNLYSTRTLNRKTEWRLNTIYSTDVLSKVLSKDNGTTSYGLVKSGTVMCLENGGNEIRPLPVADINSADTGVNVVDVDDAYGLFVGDSISILVTEDSKAQDTVTITAGATETITVTSVAYADTTIRVDLVDPSANSQPLTLSITDDGTNKDITVSLATSGAGAITSTVADVLAILNGEAGHLVTAAAVTTSAEDAVDVGPSALTGGRAVGDSVATGRTVTAVDKTSTPNTVTFDGATVTVADNDAVVATAGDIVGILETEVSVDSYDPTNGVTQADKLVTVALAGHALEAQVKALSTYAKRVLGGGYAKSNLQSDTYVTSKVTGFQFHS